MTLRRKIPLVTGLSLLAWIAALIVVSQLVILGSFRGLEGDEVRLDVERAQTAVSSQLDALRSVAGDWAPWDDAYAFVLGKNPGFIASNLTDKAIQNLALVGESLPRGKPLT